MGRKSRGRTDALLTVRVTPEELEAYKARAKETGASSMSEWARRLLNEASGIGEVGNAVVADIEAQPD